MSQDLEPVEGTKPRVRPGGLVTVAYLKARLDAGEDQLGIFMPLIVDVLPGLASRNFTAADVQEAVASRHGVDIPQGTVRTLLGRAGRKGIVARQAGRFHIASTAPLPLLNVSDEKAQVEAAQLRLGQAFQQHANRRGVVLVTPQDGLDLLLRFLEGQQVAVILGLGMEDEAPSLSRLECGVVAEFLHDVVASDPALSAVLAGIVEGLVLYHAAFLPDIAETSRKFNDLIVVFDSVLVRQALGYEGPGARALIRETMELLTRTGARCVVFDKTVQEIQRILRMYQDKLATSQGRHELRPSDMARYFLTQRYSPSDVQEMSALLEEEIASAGFGMMRTPPHVAELTHDEATLAARLADPKTRDLGEPRVQHDVDCVAGVLTLRRGHHSYRIEDARAVFATVSGRVIQNTQLWWFEHETEVGLPPIVHLRALANLAWLKKPGTNPELPLRDLVALCTAAMRPTAKMWQRFITHLDHLYASHRLSEDQVTAIIASAMTDRLLHDAELEEEDPSDVDAVTLDEVVDRVVAQYSAQADERVQTVASAYEKKLAESEADRLARVAGAEATARGAAETLRRRDLLNQGRARRWARGLSGAAYWTVVAVVLAASLVTTLVYLSEKGWLGVILGTAVVIFAVLETLGVVGHLRAMRDSLEAGLEHRFYVWLSGEKPDGPTPEAGF